MALRDKYENEIKTNPNLKQIADANITGGDKTPIESDGGLDLSTDEKAIKKARGYELGAGPSGYKGSGNTPSKKYSDTTRD